MFYFFNGKWDFERFIQVKLQLRKVELLAHVDVPVRLRNHSGDQPVSIVKVLLVDLILPLRLGERPQEVRSEEMRLQLILGEVIWRNLIVWKNVRLSHWENHLLA